MEKLTKILIPADNKPELDYYKADDALVNAVHIARVTQRPLLLMGEPGVGKSRLVEALAFSLYGEAYKDYYFEWHVKSQSKAKDGLYTFNALRALQDARTNQLLDENKDKAAYKKRYIKEGALGKAFAKSTPDAPAIILIDEIDKADVDFPNDLLLELDKAEYVIEELNETVTAKEKPIVIITSNHEKELPTAFLRRCIFHYIELPEENILIEILKNRLKQLPESDKVEASDELLEKIVKVFLELRKKESESSFLQNEKKITTAELIDWFNILYQDYKKNQPELETRLNQAIEQMKGSSRVEIPYYQALIKSREQYNRIVKGK
jgi:MoxR-like ATPase